MSSPDVLGPLAPARPARRATWPVLVIGAAATAIAVTGTAFAVSLSGGGAQPEDVLPGTALAFAKVDLDPGADQKLALFELAERFPEAADELGSADTLRDDALRLLVESADVGLDYDDDVAPWVGDRVGAALLPSDDPDEPDVVVAVAHDDADAARSALEKAGDDVPFAVLDEWVLVASSDEALATARDTDRHLSEEDAYRDAVDELDEGQLAVVWTDLGRLWDAFPEGLRDELTAQPGLGQVDLAGTVAVGLHAEDDALEVVGLARGVETGAQLGSYSTQAGTGLVEDLPADAVLAVAAGGLGQGLADAYDGIVESLEELAPDVESTVDELGLDLPEDLVTLLGDETAAAVWGSQDDPRALVRTRTDDPSASLQVLDDLVMALTGEELDGYAKEVDGGLVVGTKDEVAGFEEEGGLGDVDAFRDAVPDADEAGLVVWVDVAGAVSSTGADVPEAVEELRAVGLTVSGDETSSDLRLRVLFRG
jgi:hypothetical protein